MGNSDSPKNWEHGPSAPASSAFLEIPAELLIKSQVWNRRKRKTNKGMKQFLVMCTFTHDVLAINHVSYNSVQ